MGKHVFEHYVYKPKIKPTESLQEGHNDIASPSMTTKTTTTTTTTTTEEPLNIDLNTKPFYKILCKIKDAENGINVLRANHKSDSITILHLSQNNEAKHTLKLLDLAQSTEEQSKRNRYLTNSCHIVISSKYLKQSFDAINDEDSQEIRFTVKNKQIKITCDSGLHVSSKIKWHIEPFDDVQEIFNDQTKIDNLERGIKTFGKITKTFSIGFSLKFLRMAIETCLLTSYVHLYLDDRAPFTMLQDFDLLEDKDEKAKQLSSCNIIGNGSDSSGGEDNGQQNTFVNPHDNRLIIYVAPKIEDDVATT
jgi:hypothetical protein